MVLILLRTSFSKIMKNESKKESRECHILGKQKSFLCFSRSEFLNICILTCICSPVCYTHVQAL